MLLLIPSIEIKSGRCAQMVSGLDDPTLSGDPIEMAKLWRKENAKSLHVTDIDGLHEGHLMNKEVVRRMIETVDIPIELAGGIISYADVEAAFDLGVYRVVVGAMLFENPDDAKRAVDKYGSSKVVLGLYAEDGIVKLRGGTESSGVTAISAALNAQALGFRRIVYKDIKADATARGPNYEAIRQLADKTGLRVTVSGSVTGLDDLLKLQELEPHGIDSVVVGRALYSNKFACQGLWRLCEAGDFPYTAKV